MAKRIKIGAPVNDAEAWGFDLLERELPPDVTSCLRTLLDKKQKKSFK